MTRREKILTTGLLGVMLVFGGGFLFHLFVYEPMNQVRGRLNVERDELLQKKNDLAAEEKQIEDILRVNPRLLQWSELSLPPRDPELKKTNLPVEEQKRKHLANLRVAYETYLSDLMAKAGFRSIKVEVRTSPRLAAAAKGKEPPYEQLTFGVVGQGKKDDVVRMMREFHKAPLLHHIRNVSLALVAERAGRTTTEGLLEMNATVDALIMNGAQERTALEPKALAVKPKVLAYDPKSAKPAERDYLAMAARNMFTGVKPPVVKVDTPKVTEERADVLRFVKLTTLAYDPERKRWEAWLYDQAKGGREKKLNTSALNEFTILDKDDNPMIEAKVVKIEEEFLIILSEGKYYRLRIGDFLYPAIRSPLGKSELKELGITPDESEKEKSKKEDDEEAE